MQEVNTQMQEMFSGVSKKYDFLNHFLSGYLDVYWRSVLTKSIVSEISVGAVVLDMATGTFDVSLSLLKRKKVQIIAVDLALEMMMRGKKKICRYPTISAIQADACSLPLKEKSIDVAVVSFGIRNIVPREHVFTETAQCLKQGAPFYILEFGSPEAMSSMMKRSYILYLKNIVPFFAKMCFSNKEAYEYLSKSILSFPKPECMIDELYESGFSNVMYNKLNGGIVHIYKAIR
ncbi:MAG: ubiquinone/menaquinone biosynthesis methyltransferase [Desulfovibrionaceae bacterium]